MARMQMDYNKDKIKNVRLKCRKPNKNGLIKCRIVLDKWREAIRKWAQRGRGRTWITMIWIMNANISQHLPYPTWPSFDYSSSNTVPWRFPRQPSVSCQQSCLGEEFFGGETHLGRTWCHQQDGQPEPWMRIEYYWSTSNFSSKNQYKSSMRVIRK